jgi:hypothetical protein
MCWKVASCSRIGQVRQSIFDFPTSILTANSEVAIARGGLMRYGKREQAPRRHMRASIGYIQIIQAPWPGKEIPSQDFFDKKPEYKPLQGQTLTIGWDSFYHFFENLTWPQEKGDRIKSFEFVSRHHFLT